MKPPFHRTLFGMLGVVMAFAVTACTSTPESEDETGTENETTSSAAQEALDLAYEGVTGTPPTEPTSPASDINLWVVSCGEQVPSCSTPVAAAAEAGESIGWTVKTCDGQLNPNGWGNCIRQATSAGADVVIPVGIDCVSVQAAMQEANDKGVKIVGGGGADCNVVGGPELMASERLQLEDTSIEEYWKLNGKLQAAWLIGQTDANAKVLLLNFTDPVWGPWITAGFEEQMATCEDCEILETLDVANADMAGGALATKFSSALLQATDANAVSIPVGGWLQAGLTQAIESSGRVDDLAVASGFGDASTMDLIRSTPINLGSLGYSSGWGAYGSVDTAIRVLNDEDALVQGDGFQMVDKDNNLPDSGDYTGGVDHVAEYSALWGVN